MPSWRGRRPLLSPSTSRRAPPARSRRDPTPRAMPPPRQRSSLVRSPLLRRASPAPLPHFYRAAHTHKLPVAAVVRQAHPVLTLRCHCLYVQMTRPPTSRARLGVGAICFVLGGLYVPISGSRSRPVPYLPACVGSAAPGHASDVVTCRCD